MDQRKPIFWHILCNDLLRRKRKDNIVSFKSTRLSSDENHFDDSKNSARNEENIWEKRRPAEKFGQEKVNSLLQNCKNKKNNRRVKADMQILKYGDKRMKKS